MKDAVKLLKQQQKRDLEKADRERNNGTYSHEIGMLKFESLKYAISILENENIY